MILTLSIILFILMTVIGKKRGLKAFITLYLNYFAFIMGLILILFGLNPIIVALTISLLVSITILFVLNGYNEKTRAALISVIITLLIMAFIIYLFGYHSNINGFAIEEAEELGLYSMNINMNMTNICIAVILMGLIGSITDTAIAIASPIYEIHANNKKIAPKELFKSGMNIGKDILGTTINTLFFAFISTFMGFYIWYQNISPLHLVNYKGFASEFIRIMCSGLGCVIIIPIAALISTLIITKKRSSN